MPDGLLRQLVMERVGLETLPAVELQHGYGVRSFRDGDEPAWIRIINDSFGLDFGPNGFEERMGDAAYRPERVWFATFDGEPVATASAWHGERWGDLVGILHMVGCHSSYVGRGLGHLVSLAAMHRMRAEGRNRAVLQTDDFRLPAIRCYQRLGYRPLLFSEAQRERWLAVVTELGWSEPPTHWELALNGELAELPASK